VNGKGHGVVRDTYEDGAAIGEQIVDTIGNGDADPVGVEVVIVDRDRGAVSFGAGVFDVAGEFTLLGVDTDHGQSSSLKADAQISPERSPGVGAGAVIAPQGDKLVQHLALLVSVTFR
jgi:hypothetical protein